MHQTHNGPACSARQTSPHSTDVLVCTDDSKTRCHCGHARAEHNASGRCTGDYIGGTLTEQHANGYTCTCLCFETAEARRAREAALRILRQAEREIDWLREDAEIAVARAQWHLNNARTEAIQ